ncbi:GNAT family N-acetyltransferase [Microbulbifer magnicolonia]|uniref:GNAT family N-acetyltransferase n=1 Tax=Microbulbifer magnicolonia TaxID=3109744 RepID=UPI002B40F49F|nr:GNAT family N-acetyltransferase [Microbulbifer sp. GG15]
MNVTEESKESHLTNKLPSRSEQKTEATREEIERDPRVECKPHEARALLESWERADHKGAPRSEEAAANFHLPFLAELPGNTPYVVQWHRGGRPDGVLIGRSNLWQPRLYLANIRIPTPRLRRLEIVPGGLEAHSSDTAGRQAAYLEQLLNAGKFDCIAIYNLALDSDIGRILKHGLRYPGDGKAEVNGHWFTELNDKNGQPVIANSAKTRKNFRRSDRKLCGYFDNKVEVREYSTQDQVAEFITAAARIGERTYQHALGVGLKDNSVWHKKLGLYAANGQLRAHLLIACGKPLAYAVGALWGGTYSGIATGYLPEYRAVAPGSYLLRRMIEQFQQEGVRWFDYGIEDYGDKEIYGTLRREAATLHHYAETPVAISAIILDAAVKRTDLGIRRILQASGLLGRLKHMRRRFAVGLTQFLAVLLGPSHHLFEGVSVLI